MLVSYNMVMLSWDIWGHFCHSDICFSCIFKVIYTVSQKNFLCVIGSISVKCSSIFKIFQCGSLRFTDGKISWVSVWVGDCFFSPNNISGLRRLRTSNLAQRWCLVLGCFMHLAFWKKFFNCGRICKNRSKMPIFRKHSQQQRIRGGTMRVNSPHATSDSAEHWGPCDDKLLLYLFPNYSKGYEICYESLYIFSTMP